MSSSGKRLDGKVAIITGAAQGQGKAAALKFAREGARVVCFDIKPLDMIQGVVDEIRKLGSDGIAVHGDVSKIPDIDSCIRKTMEKFARVDILVNCAGILVMKPFLEHTEDDFNKVIDVNVKGMFLLTQRVVPIMLKQGKGRIINYASVDSFVGEENASAYCASKGAVKSLTNELALELAPKRICVNAIAPGQIDTPMLRNAVGDKPEIVEWMIKNTPYRRLGTGEDTAEAAVFLALDETEFINGTTIVVDGGWLCI
jgi:NAD(P)-dependent dehydrogenase (short-subunit alcohol dehydrogenase family)